MVITFMHDKLGMQHFDNIKGFRAGISVLTIFDENDQEHMFELSEIQDIYISVRENKMKQLEALNNIRELVNDVQYASKIPSIDDKLDIIEKALKSLEAIEEVGVITGTSTTEEAIKEVEDYLANKKKFKALEIIKEKKPDMNMLIGCYFKYSNYIDYVNDFKNPDFLVLGEKLLTQEEFDLLKEALNYGK